MKGHIWLAHWLMNTSYEGKFVWFLWLTLADGAQYNISQLQIGQPVQLKKILNRLKYQRFSHVLRLVGHVFQFGQYSLQFIQFHLFTLLLKDDRNQLGNGAGFKQGMQRHFHPKRLPHPGRHLR
jgi:hypothetical protein